jgi:hypothetical protein
MLKSQSTAHSKVRHASTGVVAKVASSVLLIGCLNGLLLSKLIAQDLQSDNTNALRKDFRDLIDVENRHDLTSVQALLLDSESTLFVAKSPDGWKGYWGKADVTNHFGELYKKPFHIDPEYATEKIVFLTPDVAETYVNVKIKADYGGFVEPSPFVMVLLWVKSSGVWKMATDIPIPILPEATRQGARK